MSLPQTINLGTVNQGDGDAVRTAFSKTVANLTYLDNTLQQYISLVGITGTQTAIDYFQISKTQNGTYTDTIFAEPGTTVQNIYFKWKVTKHPAQLISQQVGTDPVSIDENEWDAVVGGNGYVAQVMTHSVLSQSYTISKDWALSIFGPNVSSVPLFTLQKQASLLFRNRRYWGVSNLATLTQTEVKNASIFSYDYSATSSRAKTVTYDALGSQQTEGRYVYYVYPQSYGALTKVTMNGMGFSDFIQSTLTVESVTGYPVSYYVYRFTNSQYGRNIEVSWQ